MAKVLVIDDDDSVRSFLCRALGQAGHQAFGAENGRAGMEAILGTRFHVVICDMMMPVQPGTDTIQQIRELDPSLPVIAISGAFGPDGGSPLIEARALGADLALAKPFTIESLLAAIEEAFDRGIA